jgi:hypothetical protein
MRSVQLGQWVLFAWHTPTLLLLVALVGVVVLMGRSLVRDPLSARVRHLRWNLLGWASVMASLLSVVVWPYLHAVTTVRVEGNGAWRLENYLGVVLATIPPQEPRSLRAYDLGGLRWGAGHVEVVRADGSSLATVRIAGPTFSHFCEVLGYKRAVLRERSGIVVVPSHTYSLHGPVLPTIASR